MASIRFVRFPQKSLGLSRGVWRHSVLPGIKTAVNRSPLGRAAKRDRYAIWSPDGRQLTFNTNRDGNFEVYVMNADGSRPRNLSNSPKSTEGLADWAPDGRRLVFYSDRGGNKEVYILDLASLKWTNISNHEASDEYCAWSP